MLWKCENKGKETRKYYKKEYKEQHNEKNNMKTTENWKKKQREAAPGNESKCYESVKMKGRRQGGTV